MKAPVELVQVRTIENADQNRRIVVSIVEYGANWKCLRLTNSRRDPEGQWARLGYVDVAPQFMDELMLGLETAFAVLSEGGPTWTSHHCREILDNLEALHRLQKGGSAA